MASVLIIEDDEQLGRLLLLTLETAGHHPAWAANAEAALALASMDPDVVLVDMHLGSRSSSDLATELRRRLPDARLLAVSGDARSAEACDSLDGFLLKPVSLDTLLEACDDPADAGG